MISAKLLISALRMSAQINILICKESDNRILTFCGEILPRMAILRGDQN